jgi:UDP-N-acetyl-2-amino-2-deoxyglucuronate dehydrogenase
MTSTHRTRDVALVGLGNVAEPHLVSYRRLESIRIIGVVEPRADRRAEIVDRYQVQGFADLENLLSQARPDIVCILTPASTHRVLTERCAQAGSHILCEKPMALTVDDAVAMKAACEAKGVQFFYGSSYRYLSAVQRAKQLIDAGAIGAVRLIVEELIGGQGAAAYRPLSPSHYPQGGPGGGGHGLVDHGIHMLDIIPWLCGSPVVDAIGRGDRTGEIARPEFAVLTLATGAVGVVVYDGSTWPSALPREGVFSAARQWIDGRGWMGPAGQWECGASSIRVFGTDGALRIFHYANKLFRVGADGLQEYELPAHTTPWHFGVQMETFCGNLDRGEPPDTTASDGLRALQVLLSIYGVDSLSHDQSRAEHGN